MEVVLTGGPGGGKSVILSQLAPALEPLEILTVGEVPTFLALSIPSFLEISTERGEEYDHFQRSLLRLELATKKECRLLGKRLGVDIIIFDRSEIDAEIFWGEDKLREALLEEGVAREDLLQPYDLVLHLQSVAVSSPSTLEQASNNPIRSGNSSRANEAENKAWEIWQREGAHLIESKERLQDKAEVVANKIRTHYQENFS